MPVKFYPQSIRQQTTRFKAEHNALMDMFLAMIGKEVADVARESMGGPAPSPPGKPPAIRSTALRRSISFKRVRSRKAVQIGSNYKSAKIHEEGGVIVAKGRGYMRFPMLVGSSVVARSPHRGGMTLNWSKAPQVQTGFASMSTRDASHNEIWSRKRGHSMGEMRPGDVHRWITTKKVTLPERPYLRPAVPIGLPVALHAFHKVLSGGRWAVRSGSVRAARRP